MAKGKGIVVNFKANAAPVKSALSQIEKASRTLTKHLNEIDKLLEFDPSNVNLLTQKQDLLQKAIANTTDQLKGMEAAQADITAGYERWKETQQTIETNARTIANLSKQLEQATTEMNELWIAAGEGNASEQEFEAAAQRVAKLTANIDELNSKQKELADTPDLISEDQYQSYLTTVERLRTDLQQLGTQQADTNAAIADGGRSAQEAARNAEAQARADEERRQAAERAAEADRRARQASQEYKTALDKLKTSANAVKNDIQEMASVAAAGVTALGSAVAAGTAAVTKTGMEFTSSMSNVKALSGATIEDMKLLDEAAREAGANTSKSASESADALGFMALAGWDTTQMLEGLMPILRASEAGAMDLATCSDLVTDSMSALGVATGDLEHYLNICSKAQSSSNTSMQQLLEAYVGCGGMLRELNVPLETSATLLGTLANRGIKGSEAGTALNSILVNLIGANKNAASAMQDMGISAFDAQGRFIGLEETLKLVKSKLDEYGDDTEKITQLEAKLGGKTQLDTLQALLSGVSGEYDTLNEKITNCNGALESTAKTMQDNLSGDITSLKSALEGVEITIFKSLEEPFRSAAQNVTKELRDLNAACSEGELAESLSRAAQALSEFISKMAAFAADEAFPTLISWLEWVANNSDVIISAITGMGAAWASWKIMQYATHLKELVSAIQLVNSAAAAQNAAQNAVAASGNAAAASEEALAAATNKLAAAKMLAVAAAVALTAAIATFIAKQIDAAAENLRSKNQLDETTQALYDQAEAYKASAQAAEENCREADKATESTKKYWQDVKNLVDEQGRAKGSTRDLQDAVAKLNIAAGTNIEVVNGQIQGYDELVSSMDDYIERAGRAAKLSYLEDSYGEAVLYIDEVTEQYEQAYDERIKAYWDWERKRRLYNASATVSSKEERQRYKEEMDDAAAYLAETQVQENALRDRKESYEKTIKTYEDVLNEDIHATAPSKEEAMKQAGESDARRMEDINRQNAELAEQGVKQSWEDLQASLDDLDNKLAIKGISEADYWAKRRELLQDSQYKENAQWWEYFDEVEEYYDKLSETERKAQEQAAKDKEDADKEAQREQEKNIEDQIAAVKERQETDNDYTKEMMYNDMETIISGLDKESDIYKKYNAEIVKGRRELADELQKLETEKNKEKVSEIEKQLQEEVNSYKNQMQQLQKERDDYFNKWFDTSKFTSTSKQKDKDGNEADVFTLADPKEALKEIEEYEKAEEKLRARGVSENVMDWIDTLDKATAKDTIDTLNHMSDSRLQEYSRNFDAYKQKVEQKTEDKYGPQIEELNNNFVQKVDGLLAQLPGRAEQEGVNTAAGFIEGLESKSGDLSEAVTSFTDGIINGIKENLDIHSPSKETGELGENTAQGFLEKFAGEDIATAVDDFTDTFLAKLAQKDPDIKKALDDTFTGNFSESLANMDSLAQTAMSGIAAAFGGKMPSLPDITRLSLPTAGSVSEAAGSGNMAILSEKIEEMKAQMESLKAESSGSGNMTDISGKLDEMKAQMEAFKSSETVSAEQTVKLEITLTGRLEADMDKLVAVISQKLNNIAIQTGKQRFSI